MKRLREHFKQRWYNKGQKWQGQQKQKKLRSGGKNTQKNYTRKCLADLDNHDGMDTHPEPDTLECEVKWA